MLNSCKNDDPGICEESIRQTTPQQGLSYILAPGQDNGASHPSYATQSAFVLSDGEASETPFHPLFFESLWRPSGMFMWRFFALSREFMAIDILLITVSFSMILTHLRAMTQCFWFASQHRERDLDREGLSWETLLSRTPTISHISSTMS